jgi:hypothetical protein
LVEKNNCVETPKIAPKGEKFNEIKTLQAQHSFVEPEGQVHHFGSEINKDETVKMTTIRISYNTRERLDALKIDKESYESVIQRLIERSAAKKCCAARWM